MCFDRSRAWCPVPFALARALAVLLSSTLGIAQVRVAVDPAPAQSATQSRARPELYRQHVVHIATGAEPESDQPYELTRDPVLGRSDDACGTAAVPDYLKRNPYRLSFWGGDYAPSDGERLDPALARAWRDPKRERQHTYGFVMFQGRITAAKQKRVEALGVRLFEFHTFQCFTAKIPFAAIPGLLASKDVRWLGYAKPAQKLDPRVAADLGDPNDMHELFVTVFDSDMTANATRRLVAKAEVNSPAGGETTDEDADAFVTLPNGPFQTRLEHDGVEAMAYYDHMKLFVIKARGSAVIAGITRFQNAVSGSTWPHVVNYSAGGSRPPSVGLYGTDSISRTLDNSVFGARQVYCVAAGNAGRQYGYDTWLSCDTPAVAKNALTVASHNTGRGEESARFNRSLTPFNVSGNLAADSTFVSR